MLHRKPIFGITSNSVFFLLPRASRAPRALAQHRSISSSAESIAGSIHAYATQGIPITDPQDFAFFTPGLPLRGFPYDAKIGTHYVIGNLELRYPFPVSLWRISARLFRRFLRGRRNRVEQEYLSFPARSSHWWVADERFTAFGRHGRSNVSLWILRPPRFGLDHYARNLVFPELYHLARRRFLGGARYANLRSVITAWRACANSVAMRRICWLVSSSKMSSRFSKESGESHS